ncbi:uncharacterized protein LOC118556871 [Fundulus heteroclitus]|uniref:uncharacterized protein LOC118556871 n=1 Tax=Fundulus heteroclitus TaxID=8078 RepID=UPI00165BFF3B|nr:uncharacterized protein LOC118556871 [Fundulus heteroclitus]
MEFVCLNEDKYEASQLNVKNEECCVQPYAFEPLVRRELRVNTEESGESRSSDDGHASRLTSSSSDSESASEEYIDDRSHRLTNTDWCKCGNCVIMPTVDECKCCTETHLVDQEVESAGLQCITLHEGFQGNCLNQYVLKASFVEFLEGHGPLGNDEPVNEIYRLESSQMGVHGCLQCGSSPTSTWPQPAQHFHHCLPHTNIHGWRCCGSTMSSSCFFDQRLFTAGIRTCPWTSSPRRRPYSP